MAKWLIAKIKVAHTHTHVLLSADVGLEEEEDEGHRHWHLVELPGTFPHLPAGAQAENKK